jgi:hypothetical protein
MTFPLIAVWCRFIVQRKKHEPWMEAGWHPFNFLPRYVQTFMNRSSLKTAVTRIVMLTYFYIDGLNTLACMAHQYRYRTHSFAGRESDATKRLAFCCN